MEYSYDPDANRVSSSARGELHLGELLEYLGAVVEDPDIRAGFVEVVDFSGVTDLDIGYKDLVPFPGLWRRYTEKGCRCTIVFAPTDVVYGTVRMLISHLETEDTTPAESFYVVRSRAEVDELLAHCRTSP